MRGGVRPHQRVMAEGRSAPPGPCTLFANDYTSGFESTYNCENGTFGSISGRRGGSSSRQ
jgi:hypothetical protein